MISTSNQIILKNGLLVLPEGLKKADLWLKDGKIFQIVENLSVPAGVEAIDIAGKHVLPGLIDVHVHLREPGLTNKEDFATGTMAAAAGGVTTVMEMPNTIPPTTTRALIEEKYALARSKAVVNVYLYVLGVPETIDEILPMDEVIGIKIYLGASTGGHEANYEFLEYVFSKAGDKVIVVHAEDGDCLKKNEAAFAQQPHDPAIHSKIRSRECAFLAVQKACQLAKQYNTRLHIAHVSCQQELEVIAKFKNERITCEATPHHLFLDSSYYGTLGNLVKVNPPLREKEDVQALWQAVYDGLIDIIATDHAPHTLEEKMQAYDKAPSGVPGLETMLPLLLNEVNKENLSLQQVVQLTSTRPAEIFGLNTRGQIKEGFDADLVVVDMQKIMVVTNENLKTKCKWSPFNGWSLKGWPVRTFC